jgi:hypothetical protein
MERPRWPDASGVGRAGRMHLWSAYMGRMRRWSGCARQMLQWSERVARMQWWSQPRCSNEEMTILSFFLSYGRWRWVTNCLSRSQAHQSIKRSDGRMPWPQHYRYLMTGPVFSQLTTRCNLRGRFLLVVAVVESCLIGARPVRSRWNIGFVFTFIFVALFISANF